MSANTGDEIHGGVKVHDVMSYHLRLSYHLAPIVRTRVDRVLPTGRAAASLPRPWTIRPSDRRRREGYGRGESGRGAAGGGGEEEEERRRRGVPCTRAGGSAWESGDWSERLGGYLFIE